jgi:hypothetical protein
MAWFCDAHYHGQSCQEQLWYPASGILEIYPTRINANTVFLQAHYNNCSDVRAAGSTPAHNLTVPIHPCNSHSESHANACTILCRNAPTIRSVCKRISISRPHHFFNNIVSTSRGLHTTAILAYNYMSTRCICHWRRQEASPRVH